MADPDCIFCKIVAGELPATIVDEDERDDRLHGHRPGHARACARDPARARADLLSVDAEDLRAVGAGRPAAGRAHEASASAPTGVNLLNSCGAAAWQTVFHFHIHVIPRYEDDPLRLPWVPAQGDPEEIAAAAQELAGGDSELVATATSGGRAC